MAKALGWVDAVVASDSNILRDIRNAFAHNFDHELSFDTDEVSKKCAGLKVSQELIKGHDDALNNTNRNVADSIILKWKESA